MARRNRNENDNPSTENTEENSVSTVTEEVAPEVTEEATTEAPAVAEAKPEAEIDLSGFQAAVNEAIENHDNATGTVPEQFVGPVTAEYRKLDGLKAKNAAKKVVEEAMREGMASMNIGLARAYMVLSDNLTAGATAKAERVPADPTEALVQRVAGLNLARELVVVPEGVSEGWEDKVEELLTAARDQASAYQAYLADESEDKGDEPETPGWVKAAVKLAQGKSAKVGGSTSSGPRSEYTGERRDIGKHIAEAFEGEASGTFKTVAEIRSFKSAEYGDNPPSAGAISARLFPKTGTCTLDFVTPDTNEKGNKGARKV